jgi:hypothetical protein
MERLDYKLLEEETEIVLKLFNLYTQRSIFILGLPHYKLDYKLTLALACLFKQRFEEQLMVI